MQPKALLYIDAAKRVANRKTVSVCWRVQHRGLLFYIVFVYGSGARVGQPRWSNRAWNLCIFLIYTTAHYV